MYLVIRLFPVQNVFIKECVKAMRPVACILDILQGKSMIFISNIDS